jgi:hypothetical protein
MSAQDAFFNGTVLFKLTDRISIALPHLDIIESLDYVIYTKEQLGLYDVLFSSTKVRYFSQKRLAKFKHAIIITLNGESKT